MPQGFTIFWTGLAIFYAILALSNYRWIREIRMMEKNSDHSVYISGGSLSVGGEPKDERSIRVSGMFKSILITDVAGLVIGLIAAVLSVLSA